MELDSGENAPVDPEVRAYIYSLVSALGGTGASGDGRYVLGDDALACLKDIKRWIKLYDERLNRLDVARCLGESNLVRGDLLEILALWTESGLDDRLMSKIALASLELLVPLTWPIEKNDQQMTRNHHRHMPYLQAAQTMYKRSILTYDATPILRAAVRLGLPSIALDPSERTGRDEGIIKIILYFLRNVAMIALPPWASDEDDEDNLTRSATIEAFHVQDIFQFLMTIGAGIGEEFNTQDVVVLEVLFHILKGVDIEKLFMNDIQVEASKDNELRTLLEKEAGMRRDYARNAPTRHNRFGTMIWIKRDDNRVSTVSGQDVLLNNQKSLAKIDDSKQWKRPKPRVKEPATTQIDMDMPTPLTPCATRHLRAFVEDFLDSAFNPLFSHVRKAIEREADRIVEAHRRQFFYLVGWFLQAERVRHRQAREGKGASPASEEDADTYAVIASVLTQETFIALNRFMQESIDQKEWQDLTAGMRCFTQILLTVQEMSESSLEDDQTIAENILNRIFYEETTHDRMVIVIRSYANQGLGYLDACTELAHVYLRMLEHYSKQNMEMQVRSRRRARRKKNAVIAAGEEMKDAAEDEAVADAEDMAHAQRVSSERKFDFHRFAGKFMTQACVDTFVALARCYADLTPEQLKRAHRFFYRVAFKMEMSVMLMRVDIVALFYKMIKGPQGLVHNSPAFGEWDEIIRQIFKRLARKMADRPSLVVEMLFSKINATVHFLEHGRDKEVTARIPRAPAELEVKPGFDLQEQIGIVVSILLNLGQQDTLEWIEDVLKGAIIERQAWEVQAMALQSNQEDPRPRENLAPPPAPSMVVKPDNEARRLAILKNNKLRLLMTLVGFQQLGVDDEVRTMWTIPSFLTSIGLRGSLAAIEAARSSPPVFDDDKSAEDLIRRKSAAPRRRAAFDDDSDDGIDHDEGEADFMFPAGGPTFRKADAVKKPKKRRNRDDDDTEPMTDAQREARAEARREADLERRRKIKSALYIHDSDDEDDEERDQQFFRQEEKRREKQQQQVLSTLASRASTGALQAEKSGQKMDGSRKRKSGHDGRGGRKSRRVAQSSLSDDENSIMTSAESSIHALSESAESTEEEEKLETPPSSPRLVSSQDELRERARSMSVRSPAATSVTKLVRHDEHVVDSNMDDEDDDAPVAMSSRRARGILIDSDSE
ncbi:MAG: Topoisomerase 1-associated factor 1 [Thelocarpon superellum]|nr:MAG: Topoisomerase 1-associated factor 1 [Thelocarpon superellum]